MFFYHCFFPFGINVIIFFIITYFFCVSLQKSTFNKFSQFLYNFGSPHGMYEFRGTSASGEPLSLSCRSLTFSDKIKAYTGDMPFFIFCIIPHIDSIFRNLTGFCDFFRSAWFSVQIKRNTFFPVNLKFFTECLCRILFYP